ncbi:DUF2938 family protein [Rhodospirillaceae bacterium SYSU D60014]|uniref:DUF2938 family protein n=1 Tax=Virgifigura deserti TaxID=2268457 RepID=UPI000E67279B
MSDVTVILAFAIPVGIIATLFMDGVVFLRQRIWGAAVLDYRMVGRWIGHFPKGRFSHTPITASSPIAGEAVIGWTAHYLIGMTFALGLIASSGWPPSFGGCLLTGLLTSAAPFLIMQPGMGRGIAASKTPQPNTARKNTLVTHLSFGIGLYLGVLIWSAFS